MLYSFNSDIKKGRKKEKLSTRKLSLNEKVKNMRARVEFPFGSLKTKFESLGKPWFESIEQQEYAIQYAVGVYNYEQYN